jgi:hypothetical protein
LLQPSHPGHLSAHSSSGATDLIAGILIDSGINKLEELLPWNTAAQSPSVHEAACMTDFFRREAKLMLIWSLAVPALLGVFAIIGGFF